MRKKTPKQQLTISTNSSIDNRKGSTELRDEELKKVSGGTVKLSDPEEGGQVRAR
jgi:bacteriocin-like protein